MIPLITLPLFLAVNVDSQHLRVAIEPHTHTVTIASSIKVHGPGTLALLLSDNVQIDEMRLDRGEVLADFSPADNGSVRIELELPDTTATLEIVGRGVFEEDVAAGERPGEIHNFAVQAHVGPDGIFLSDGSNWHPRPIDADGTPLLHAMSVEIEPLPGWAFVASGDPTDEGDLAQPRWRWQTPRPVDGLAVVGNRHELRGVVHETAHGPVEIVMHVPPEHLTFTAMYLEAAVNYLDLYVPRLGAFPYQRFSIVENFFSSGFAFPGFTVLGPRVVAMAPRSLAPGYLDHELLHNWWGNGVYVDPSGGNWCEALTSYGANYWRRVAEEGEEAGRDYRRGILMKLSTAPEEFDDGPLRAFGSADPSQPGPDRFVGYDKGAFVFFMLGEVIARDTGGAGEQAIGPMWQSLRRFAEGNLGRRANWADLQAAFEASMPQRPSGWLDGFFTFWVEGHPLPQAVRDLNDPVGSFLAQFPASTDQSAEIRYGVGGEWCEIDPDFRLYRVLPPEHLVPTIAGTTGPGGVRVVTSETRPEVTSYLPQLNPVEDGENLMLIGADAISEHHDLLAETNDPIVVRDSGFTVGGETYSGASEAILHTMAHPRQPGRYITIVHSNGEPGWSRLRVIQFYTRDTTIVWDGEEVVARRTYEPSRRLPRQ